MKGPFLIAGEDSSALSFCDIGCFNTYSFYVDVSDVASGKRLKPNPNVCFYCAACGKLIHKTIDCMLHDDHCPPWLWFSAYPTMQDFIDAYEEQMRTREIPVEVWNAADRVAMANPLISGTDLALITIDRLGL